MTKQHRTDWFHKAKWGVFMHFLGGAADGGADDISAEAWNNRVDAFDVDGLAAQLQAVGAGYFIMTIGQNSGHYCAPNHTYDSLTGIRPSKCSKRDLIAELSDALAPTGIRLLVYSSSVGPGRDHEARKGLKQYHEWNDADHNESTDWNRYRQVEHMLNWEKVLGEWSQRWGNKISGWWIDGCYHKAERYPETEEPNLKTLANVLRSGNPDSIIAFNPGVRVPVGAYSEHEDYTGGEVSGALPLLGEEPAVLPVRRFLDGEQYHILTFLGDYWGHGEPRFNGYFVAGYTEHINRHGGVITWDVPRAENGLITASAMKVLSRINC
jgi:Alpha-L-fucosidase